jgi:hypothetical protein
LACPYVTYIIPHFTELKQAGQDVDPCVFERPAHGGKGVSERKNFGGDQQIGVLGPDRMPIDPFRPDGDFRQQIRRNARQRDT